MTSRPRLGTSLVSLAIVAVGAGVLWMTAQLPVAAAFAKIGPRAFPYAVGTMLVGLGLLLVWDSRKDRWHCEANDPDEPAPDLGPLLWVAAGLVANLVLIKAVGFILSSTVMYVLVAYLGFAELLGLRMGDGLIEDFF